MIKKDICEAFDKLYALNGLGFGKLNEALITLLPKKPDASSLADYRPISLIHSIAKLISKVMSLRIANVIHTLISPAQSAFLRTKCIHDSFLYIQNCVKALHRKKTPAVLLKLDISKVFDSLSRPFLFEVLHAKGFSDKWISWIATLLTSASSRIVVNGCMTDKFMHACGLRQGDSISPLLFVIAMETLTTFIIKAHELKIL